MSYKFKVEECSNLVFTTSKDEVVLQIPKVSAQITKSNNIIVDADRLSKKNKQDLVQFIKK